MDPETREYLEGFAKSINGRFDSVDARLNSMDGRFDSIDARLDSMDARLGTVETQLRHTNVLVEDLRGQIQLVAEGVKTANERIDRLDHKVDQLFQEESAARDAGDRALESRIRGRARG